MLINLLSRFFCFLPLSWALGIGRAMGWFWFHILPIRRQVALQNIRRALGDSLTPKEQRRIIAKSFEHLCMLAVETLRLPTLDEQKCGQLINWDKWGNYDKVRARGQGLIAILAHLGNFDMLAVGATLRGEPVATVAKDIKSPGMRKFFDRIHARANLKIFPPRNSRDLIREVLARQEVMAFMVDQHLSPRRALVCSFFGMLVATTPAPFRFALESGAPIIPVVIFRDKRPGYHIARAEPEFVIETPFDDPQKNLWHNTERMNRLVESWVRERPEEYFWVHKRFKVHDNPQGWDVPPELKHLLKDSGKAI